MSTHTLTTAQRKGLVDLAKSGDCAHLASTTVNRLVAFGLISRVHHKWIDRTGRTRHGTSLVLTEAGRAELGVS